MQKATSTMSPVPPTVFHNGTPYMNNHGYHPHQSSGGVKKQLSAANRCGVAASTDRLYHPNPAMSRSTYHHQNQLQPQQQQQQHPRMTSSYHETSKSSTDLSSRAPPVDHSRTSKVRLETYYRLSWEDEDAKKKSIFAGTTAAEPAMTDGTGSSDGDGSRRVQDEEELATRMLQIQSKRFYLDVKQNWRGRFIKIAEVGAGGRKSRLVMSMGAAAEFRDHLVDFGEFYAQLGPQQPDHIVEDGQLKSEVMMRENRRYYIDLKENTRGRFLRVTQSIFHGPRALIVVPAQGIDDLRSAFDQLLLEWATDEPSQDTAVAAAGAVDQNNNSGFQGELPEAKQIRVENKVFYFDTGRNSRGVFMRISEVKNNFRSSVTIPERSWSRFRDIFVEACEKMAAQQPDPVSNQVVEFVDDSDDGLVDG